MSAAKIIGRIYSAGFAAFCDITQLKVGKVTHSLSFVFVCFQGWLPLPPHQT